MISIEAHRVEPACCCAPGNQSSTHTMLSTMSLAGRAPALLRHGRRVPVPRSVPARALSLGGALNSFPRTLDQAQRERFSNQKRSFTRTAVRASSAATQPAPNPRAYLESGVIKPREHIDVKKVLVIGSGGLAIGQAGEFDYSGLYYLGALSRPARVSAGRRRVTRHPRVEEPLLMVMAYC